MSYTVAFAAECDDCGVGAILTAFKSTRPPGIEALGTEGADSACISCQTPLRMRLVGVTLDGFEVVHSEDD